MERPDSGSPAPAPEVNVEPSGLSAQPPSTSEVIAEYGGKSLFSLGLIEIGVLVGARGCLDDHGDQSWWSKDPSLVREIVFLPVTRVEYTKNRGSSSDRPSGT